MPKESTFAMMTALVGPELLTGVQGGNNANATPQLLNALIKSNLSGTDTGAANAYVVNSPQPGAENGVQAGIMLCFTPLHSNTGPSTLNWNSYGVLPIVGETGAALIGGELSANGPVLLQATATQWQIVATTGAQFGNQRTTAEVNAGVTPSNYSWPAGDPRRYGAKLDGINDDTAALTTWASVGGILSFPAMTALISAPIPLVSNSSVESAMGGGVIKTATGGISMFTANGKTDVSVFGIKFLNTGTSAPFPVLFAHCYFVGCSRPVVENCEFSGMNCGGIYFDACTDPIAQNNIIYGGVYPTNQQQTFDIGLFGYTGSTVRGVITGNSCYGGGNFGIAVQDAYSFFNPSNNLISGNRIGGSQLYGILNYMPSYASQNCYNQITNNYIENIKGVTNIIGGSGGAGIYVVGAGAGGTMVEGNTVVNCCINTVARSLAPAGIGISQSEGGMTITVLGGGVTGTINTSAPFPNGNWNGTSGQYIVNFAGGFQRLVTFTNGSANISWATALATGTTTATLAGYYGDPISVVGNKISGMTQYDGILVISNIAGVVVSGNTVNMPPSNTTGYALHIENSSYVTATGNVLQNQGLEATVYVESIGINISGITIKGNQILGGADTASTGCVQITGDGTAYCAGLNLSDNQVVPNPGGAGSAAIWINNASVKGGQIRGNYANVATMPALIVVGCTGLRCSDNILETTGATAVSLSGTCSGSFFDKTNLVSGGVIANTSNGFVVHQLGTAAPATGSAELGDTVYNTLGATPLAWNCTVAGSPGTWTGLTLP
jgi:parallel beta-helix repeat protein